MKSQPEYDTQSLKSSIAHRRKTIDNLRQAISIEETNIAKEREMIETLERKSAIAEGITIDAGD